MEDEVRRRRAIDVFAKELVRSYGFRGDEAGRERSMITFALVNGEAVDYDVLRRRVRSHVRQRDLGSGLRDLGLTDEEVDRLLPDDSPGDNLTS